MSDTPIETLVFRRNVRLRLADLDESMNDLARKAGISRQALTKRLAKREITAHTRQVFSILLAVPVSALEDPTGAEAVSHRHPVYDDLLAVTGSVCQLCHAFVTKGCPLCDGDED